jgi:uncharacterized protein involved in exopolysaccharide biosynthesis
MDANSQTAFCLRDFITVFFKRKKTIFFVWMACVAMVAAYSSIAKPIYESSARLLIKVGRENIYVSPLSTGGAVVDSNLEDQLNSEVEILKSRLLAEKVLTLFAPTSIYPVKNSFISSVLAKVKPLKGSENSAIGNAINKVLQYFENNTTADNSFISTVSGKLKSLINPETPRIENAHKNAMRYFLKNLKVEGIKKTNVIRISFRHTDPELCAKILNTLVNLYQTQHLQIHQTALSFDFSHEQGSKLKAELMRAEAALNDFKRRYKIDSSPQEQTKLLLVKEFDMRAELMRTESFEKEAQTRIDYYKNRTAKTYDVLLKSQAELKEAGVKKNHLLKQLAEYRRELQQLSAAEDKFINLQQQVEMYRHNFNQHQAKNQEESYLTALDKNKVSNVSVIDPAWPPLDPVTPKGFFTLVSLFLGGMAGIGLALFLEYFDDHIATAQDVESCLPGLALLASIPTKPKKRKQRPHS